MRVAACDGKLALGKRLPVAHWRMRPFSSGLRNFPRPTPNLLPDACALPLCPPQQVENQPPAFSPLPLPPLKPNLEPVVNLGGQAATARQHPARTTEAQLLPQIPKQSLLSEPAKGVGVGMEVGGGGEGHGLVCWVCLSVPKASSHLNGPSAVAAWGGGGCRKGSARALVPESSLSAGRPPKHGFEVSPPNLLCKRALVVWCYQLTAVRPGRGENVYPVATASLPHAPGSLPGTLEHAGGACLGATGSCPGFQAGPTPHSLTCAWGPAPPPRPRQQPSPLQWAEPGRAAGLCQPARAAPCNALSQQGCARIQGNECFPLGNGAS